MIIESDDDSIIYNVGFGKAYSLEEILKYIISLSDQEIEVVIDPEKYRPIDTPLICCNHSLIKKNLGWKPEHDILETIKQMFFYYRNKEE